MGSNENLSNSNLSEKYKRPRTAKYKPTPLSATNSFSPSDPIGVVYSAGTYVHRVGLGQLAGIVAAADLIKRLPNKP
jgi:hypothetical protein